jgi:hypothetical protein
MKGHLAILVTLALLWTSPASAQNDPKSDTEGLFLNAHFNTSSWDLADDTEFGELERESGLGLGFEFGYGASQAVALLMAFDAARMDSGDDGDDYTLVHFGIGARVTLLGQQSMFRPFAKATFGARTVELDLDQRRLTMFGAGFTGGAGVLVFVSPAWAITGEALFTWGSMTEITSEGVSLETDIGASSNRFNVGLTWWPGR